MHHEKKSLEVGSQKLEVESSSFWILFDKFCSVRVSVQSFATLFQKNFKVGIWFGEKKTKNIFLRFVKIFQQKRKER
jgi:hypothetical protein